jgi:hypothetical protein
MNTRIVSRLRSLTDRLKTGGLKPRTYSALRMCVSLLWADLG